MIVYAIWGLTPKTALAIAPLGEAWHDFYLMAGTASVTLVGLLFIALSLHAEVLFRREHREFRELAAEAFQGYLYVLITALTFLLPSVDGRTLALMYGLINIVMLGRTAWRVPSFFAARRARVDKSRKPWRIFVPAVAYLLGLFAVIQLLSGKISAGFSFLAPIAMMLAASTRTAWDLLEYVGRVRAGNPGED